MLSSLNLPIPFLNKKNKNEDLDEHEQLELKQIEEFSRGLVTIQDIIAPEAIEVDFTYQKINSSYSRTLFVAGYPRSVPANWLSPLINFPTQTNISMFIFPMDSSEILDNLKRKITEMEAEIQSDIRSGKISNINTEIKLNDARVIREQLAAGAERFYQFGLYITIKADSVKELDRITKSIQSTLGALLIVSKKATLQMDEGFKTTLPMGTDLLQVTRNMDTTSLATTFPFTSSELTMDTGILYGINEHNESLVIFDRFRMESYNMLILAKSGAGKSYTVKLEILRQLMFDTEIIVLDPEQEYEDLCKMVGGEYINFTFGSKAKINPFDLSQVYEEGQNELGQKILSLHGLLKVMLGEMSAEQDALLDRALIATYKAKGITPDPATQKNTPPMMEDLYKTIIGMESAEADDIAARLEKYITGSTRGIFDQASNINIRNEFTVFSVKEMEDELRPIAMYVILDFIWTRVKKEFKKRLLIIDEAWYFMQHPDSAKFIYSMTKRARKYYLGITTITQDVEDFLHNDFGKAIVSNASIKFLMKQSTASIPVLSDAFYLSEGERQLLVSADVGEGVFFAGQNHVALRVVASDEEHQVITTDPREIDARRKRQKMAESPPTPTTPNQTQAPAQTQGKTVLPNKEVLGQLMSSLAVKSNEPNKLNPQQNQPERGGHYTIDDYKEPT
ncbi:MAG: Type IV secretory pathway VirB4 components-like protein [Microgenomates bacterium 39_7]|nr:MAG: Type IV secretory pathway VirB4 components-like protein [Microgenomates bacterium 39_7]